MHMQKFPPSKTIWPWKAHPEWWHICTPLPIITGYSLCASPSGDEADLQCQIKSRDERHVWSRCWGLKKANTSSRIRVGAHNRTRPPRCRRARGFRRAPRLWARRARLRRRRESAEPNVQAPPSVLHVSPWRRRSSAPPRARRNWRNSAYIPRAR